VITSSEKWRRGERTIRRESGGWGSRNQEELGLYKPYCLITVLLTRNIQSLLLKAM
jgi:hypothetical protein